MATETGTIATQFLIEALVERHVRQIRDGEEYSGHLKIGDTYFDYSITFGIPLSELEEMPEEELQKRKSEIRQLFSLTVKRGDMVIELAEEEYLLLINIIMATVVKFYNDRRTRTFNESPLMGAALRGEKTSLPETGGFTASISMTITSSCVFPSEICAMLRASKFGCTF